MDVINQLFREDAMLREVSPILFLMDAPGWPVIAARTPDGCVKPGDSLRPLLRLSAEDEAFIGGWFGGTRLVGTALGAGFLSMKWRFGVGIWMFLRLELPLRDVRCAARAGLIAGNFSLSPSLTEENTEDAVPPERAERAAEAVCRAVDVLRRIADSKPVPDTACMIPIDRLTDWIEGMAQAVGGVVRLHTPKRRVFGAEPVSDLPPDAACLWYAEETWEALLVLCLLSARAYAPDRVLSCTPLLGENPARDMTELELCFDVMTDTPRQAVPPLLHRRRTEDASETLPAPPEQPAVLPPCIAAGLNRLKLAVETYDGIFRWTADGPEPFDGMPDALLYTVRVNMAYPCNPHRELDGDIKVPRLLPVYDI